MSSDGDKESAAQKPTTDDEVGASGFDEDGEKESAAQKTATDDEAGASGFDGISMIEQMMKALGMSGEKAEKPEPLLEEFTLEGVVKYIQSEKCKNIITMAGAGISTSAGIPDFRSPGTGLYDKLSTYNLPNPQAIFDIAYFKEHPEPFFKLAKDLWPGNFEPTPCHYFIKMLKEKGLLLRHFTQNIDTLEHVAGLESEDLVEAHGTFHTSHCTTCNEEYSQDWIRDEIMAERIPKCTKENCGNLVKPDIVFFGEKLPDKFFGCVQNDLPKCDLLIVLGTSLVVQPFASIVYRVPEKCPRLYINLEKPPGSGDPMLALLGLGHGFQFDASDNYRDVFWEGLCDDGCQQLAEKLGWKDELQALVAQQNAKTESKTPKL